MRSLEEYGIVNLRCSLNRKDALRYLGYRGQEIDDVLMARFEDIAVRCESAFPVIACWRIFPIEDIPNGIALAGTPIILPGQSIAKFLDGTTHVALMACTLGMDCERELNKLEATDLLESAIFDACASSLVEAGADACQLELCKRIGSALGLDPDEICHGRNRRFSPGYGDLPIETQRGIIDALDATKNIGLFVTDSNMMVPTKSITALVGIFGG